MIRRRLSNTTQESLAQQRVDSSARILRLERSLTREREKLAALDEVLTAATDVRRTR